MTGLSYYTIRAGSDTFGNSKIASLVGEYIDPSDRVLNPCAGPTELETSATVIRNDIDESVSADYHSDARNISDVVEDEVDVVVYDPPFSKSRHVDTYGLPPETWPGYEPAIREFDKLLVNGGCLVQFGFSVSPIPQSLRDEYQLTDIVVLNQLGRMHDWIMSVYQKSGSEGRNRPWSIRTPVVPNQHQILGDHSGRPLTYHATPGEVEARDIWSILRGKIAGPTLLADWGKLDLELGLRKSVERFSATEQLVSRVDIVGENRADIDFSSLRSSLRQTNIETIILWPPDEASSWITEYRGERVGYLRAIKQEIDRYVGGGMRTILVGNTATGMRSEWNWEHTDIQVVDGAGAAPAWYISTFIKSQRGLCEEDTNIECPIDNRHWDGEPGGSYVIKEPHVTLDREPAWNYHCPKCGAAADNMCHTDYGYLTNRHGSPVVHEERKEWARDRIRKTGEIRVYECGRYLGTVEVSRADNNAAQSRATLDDSEETSEEEPTQFEDTELSVFAK